MYGEDVDISYRLRNMDYVLRYCPSAVVWHYTYDKSDQCKPLQDKWSKTTNLYLRIKFGTFWDIAKIPILMGAWFFRPPRYTGARYQAVVGIIQVFRMVPKAIAWRSKRRRDVFFDFSFFDYGLTRYGAFYEFNEKAIETPLASILTRTFPGRELYLLQALLSVRNQTYKNIEHVIVEDGGSTYADLVKRFNLTSEYPIRYFSLEKVGRSKTGNEALSQATGEYCLFLDDDDLLYSDHIEVLVDRALQYPEAGGSYSLAFEVATDTRKILVDGAYCEKSYILLSKYQQDFNPELLLKTNYFSIQSVLFKRSLFMEHGGLDERLDALEDWNLWIRYSRKNRFVYVAKLTSLYRVPSNLRIAATRILKLQEIREIAVGSALNSSQHDKSQ
jgi:GT2 family glycosyltransferase